MSKRTDVRVIEASLFFIPVRTRVPLKFGPETLTSSTIARVRVKVTDHTGHTAEGWGEIPLSVQWVWPSKLAYEPRHQMLQRVCVRLTEAWAQFDSWGHPIEVGHDFVETVLPKLLEEANDFGLDGQPLAEKMPWLGALVCCSPFDMALHDAYGNLHQVPVYSTYNAEYMNRPLDAYLSPASDSDASFHGKYPADYFVSPRPNKLLAWHLVGGLDWLDNSERNGDEPDDEYPVTLPAWIRRDGLRCLKVKLRGNDSAWDYDRLVKVGQLALDGDVQWLTSDFNCTVHDPEYVNDILDQLNQKEPEIYKRLLYVEQPFPYELEEHRIDVHSVSKRKPLYMDESAHDWKLVRFGRALGWTGVALKTCKTQTGALLAGCWAKAHGMGLMVQDLTNPMLAQIPHVLLAAHMGTIAGVETNAMQFYPDASDAEAVVHPGLYQRRNGQVDLSTISGPGFGYRVNEIHRELPPAVAHFADHCD
ncbi:MAG: mandelate racemase/muconate lactonizing enzyme family protein [Phycisphaerae bacterium]|nr:mandelate racemase/muconate lactonizing enzyme family protein [Phycisphaerae bacterium]